MQKSSRSTVRRFSPLLTMLLVLVPSLAGAALLEEVLVTAQKREQSIYDVGIAITAFSGEQIDRLGYTDSTQVAALASSVDISAGGGGQNQQFVIRGASLNEFNEIVEGTTAVYLDEGYVANIGAGIFGLFDIERVEILKGPQGTLFGRNATAGLVHYISRAPTDEFEGYADLTYGSHDQVNFQGAVSGALSDDLRGRAALYYNRHDAIFNNLYPLDAVGGAVPGGGQDHWNDEVFAGRVRFQFDINEQMTFDFMAHGYTVEQGENPYQSIPTVAVLDAQGRQIQGLDLRPNDNREGIGPGGVALDLTGDGNPFRPVPGGDFFGYIDPDGSDNDISKDWAFDDLHKRDMYGFSGKLNWELDNGMLLTAISDYKKLDRRTTTDVDAAPVNQLVYEQLTDQWQFSQEVRLSAESERMRWVAGLYYLHVKTDFIAGFMIPPGSLFQGLGPVFGIPAGAAWDAPNDEQLQTDSYSVFGQVEYDLNEQFTLIGGLRVIQEEKDFWFRALAGVSTELKQHDLDQPTFFFPTSAEDPSGAPYAEETSDTLWAGKLQLDWKPNDDWLVYLSLNRGVKAGNFQAPLPLTGPPLAADDIGYDEEKLLAYELGFKAQLWDGKARLSGSVYHYNYDDYHNFSFVGVSSVVTNQEATNTGIEFDLAMTPIEGLDVVFGVGAFDFTVEDVSFGGDLIFDREPTYSPQVTWAGLVRYEWPAFNGSLAVQMDANWRSSFYTNINNFEANEIDATIRGNASLSYYTADGKWEATVFVNNIADARNEWIHFDLSTLCGCHEVAYEKPRWFGASIRYNF